MSSRKWFLDLTRPGQKKRLKTMCKDSKQDLQLEVRKDSPIENTFTPTHTNCLEVVNQYENVETLAVCGETINVVHTASEGQTEGEENRSTEETVPQSPSNELPSLDESDSSSDDFNLSGSQEQLLQSLRDWCIHFNISLSALSALLVILKVHTCFTFFPSDARTFLHTPKSLKVKEIQPEGYYYHLGIEFFLKKIWEKVSEAVTSFELMVGIDGIPLFSSTCGEFWPILVSVTNISSVCSKIFPVGIFYGEKKPADATTFLNPFVTEISNLIQNGLMIDNKRIPIYLKGITCDAPAKSFILGTKGHAGYSSCTRCKQTGQMYQNRMTFPEFKSTPRTHEGFISREDEDFHVSNTPLISVPGLNLVSSFPLDYMHLVCLGTVRTMLSIWTSGPLPLRLHHQLVNCISTSLLTLRSCIPVEFCRKPRRLDELKRWKATEFRQFLLYTGPLVLQQALYPNHEHIYHHFLSLHISLTILLSPIHCKHYQAYAKNLLEHFVKSFKDIYGQQYMTHNLHGLLHLADDVSKFGPLDSCSAFQFENFLYTMKCLIRKGDKPLQQIVNRILEMTNNGTLFHDNNAKITQKSLPIFSKPHFSGPLIDGCVASQQYKEAEFYGFKLKTTTPDSCCELTDGSIVIVENFVYSSTLKSMGVVCRKFMDVSNFYNEPFCPSSALGIFQVRCLSNVIVKNVSEISKKLVSLTLNEKTIVLPLLHTSQFM